MEMLIMKIIYNVISIIVLILAIRAIRGKTYGNKWTRSRKNQREIEYR